MRGVDSESRKEGGSPNLRYWSAEELSGTGAWSGEVETMQNNKEWIKTMMVLTVRS